MSQLVEWQYDYLMKVIVLDIKLNQSCLIKLKNNWKKNKKLRKKFLVNLGAGEGYHPIGLLKKKIFVEVKNTTLFRKHKIAEFPDAITTRGSKHLKTLIDAIKKGYKSYILFLVQIQGMEYFRIAKDIDKEYYKNYLIAKKSGVNFLAYRCNISPKEIKIEKKIKIIDE